MGIVLRGVAVGRFRSSRGALCYEKSRFNRHAVGLPNILSKGEETMQITNVLQAGTDYSFKWPDGSTEIYPNWIDYEAFAGDGTHKVKIGFCHRAVYGQKRVRVTVWIDEYPHAEFFGSDDFDASGEVLSEIRVHGKVGEVMCSYPDDAIPECYTIFNAVGLPTRVGARGAHKAWAVVANISDHRTMIALAALRRMERNKT